MAQDPYGYKDSPGAAVSTARAGSGSQTMWLGVGALAVCAIAPCMGQIPHLVALPLGAWALWSGMQASSALGQDADGRAMNSAGMLAGGVAALISGLMTLFIGLYVAFLFAMIAFGVLAGNQ